MGGAGSLFCRKQTVQDGPSAPDAVSPKAKQERTQSVSNDLPESRRRSTKSMEVDQPKGRSETSKKLSSFFSEKQIALVFYTSLKVSPEDVSGENGQGPNKVIPLTEENLKKLDDWNNENAEDIELYRWKRCVTLDQLPENQDQLNAAFYRRSADPSSLLKKHAASDFNLLDLDRRVSTVANQSLANLNDVSAHNTTSPAGKTQPNLPTIDDPSEEGNVEVNPELLIQS